MVELRLGLLRRDRDRSTERCGRGDLGQDDLFMEELLVQAVLECRLGDAGPDEGGKE
jgi:hypothetical protein